MERWKERATLEIASCGEEQTFREGLCGNCQDDRTQKGACPS